MEKNEISNKKSKRRSKGAIVLLILLLLLVGAVSFLYYSVVKAPLELDNPQQMAASAPMSVEERFRFFSAEQTVQVRMDAADIWSLILAHTGNDFLDTINEKLSSYPVSVSGCAIRMDEDGLRMDLELFYGNTRLVTRVPCELEISGHHISLTPIAVKLGVIPLPVGGLLSSVKLEYDLQLPVLSDVTQLSFVRDGLLLTGTMEQDFRSLVPRDKTLDYAKVFCESMQFLADSLQTGEGYTALMSRLEQEPGLIETLYRDLFILAGSEVRAEYLESRYGLTQRFFPGIDFTAVTAEHEAINEQINTQSVSLTQFFTKLVNDYNDKNFRLSGGEFLQNGKPFQAAQYGAGEYDALFELLNPDSFFLIIVDAENGYIRKTSSFYKITDENQQFSQPVDFNKTYILGCVFRSVTDDPFLMYETEVNEGSSYYREIVLVPLTDEEVSALQVPGVFGVWVE